MDKLFTPSEKKYLQSFSGDERERMIWLFWSMKESAYKALYKQYSRRFYAPKMFDCSVNEREEDCLAGTVQTLFQDFCTQSYLLEDCIHTVAYINERQVIHDFCFPVASDDYGVQASTVRHRLCKALSQLEGCNKLDVEIRKDHFGIPRVYIGNKKTAYDVSLSHHGTFGAYALSHELD